MAWQWLLLAAWCTSGIATWSYLLSASKPAAADWVALPFVVAAWPLALAYVAGWLRGNAARQG